MPNIERGQQTSSIETLAELARELGVPIAEFFDADADVISPTDGRLRAEARLRELVRDLDDDALGLVIEQAAAFAKYVKSR